MRVYTVNTTNTARQCLYAVDAWTIAFSSDSRFIASGSHAGRIILYGVESGQKEVQLDTRGGKFALSIAYVSVTYHCYMSVVGCPLQCLSSLVRVAQRQNVSLWPAFFRRPALDP